MEIKLKQKDDRYHVTTVLYNCYNNRISKKIKALLRNTEYEIFI